ncbi:hypothetical protein [Enterobacter sp. R1(2018)]|uniref:hypothetical protein n=1 Tax=Enterobacter sp. R1(2018) TaxID=2447891 RepID=UPI000EB1F8B3|nr:hypothetical protein [Enterobacter sp. R1(2018)]RKQ41274.1 hypothetical protein D8M09_02765 [Enterobacter sp. R1(2018)]
MENISVYTKTIYTFEAVKYLIDRLSSKGEENEKLAIFVFENSWVSINEFLALKYCLADRILIIGQKKTINFLGSSLRSNKYYYINFEGGMCFLFAGMKDFIVNRGGRTCSLFPVSKHPGVKELTAQEYKVMSMYIGGLSVQHISSIVGLSIKRVYAIKNYGMRKKGLWSDAALVRHWEIITRFVHLKDYPPPQINILTISRRDIQGYMIL